MTPSSAPPPPAPEDETAAAAEPPTTTSAAATSAAAPRPSLLQPTASTSSSHSHLPDDTRQLSTSLTYPAASSSSSSSIHPDFRRLRVRRSLTDGTLAGGAGAGAAGVGGGGGGGGLATAPTSATSSLGPSVAHSGGSAGFDPDVRGSGSGLDTDARTITLTQSTTAPALPAAPVGFRREPDIAPPALPTYVSPGSLLGVAPPPAPAVRPRAPEEEDAALPLASPLATSTSRGLGILGLDRASSSASSSPAHSPSSPTPTMPPFPLFTTTAPTPPTLEPTQALPPPPPPAPLADNQTAGPSTAAASSPLSSRSRYQRRARTPSPPPPPPVLPMLSPRSKSGSTSPLLQGAPLGGNGTGSIAGAADGGGIGTPPTLTSTDLRRSKSRGELYPGRWAASRSQRTSSTSPRAARAQSPTPIGLLGSPVTGHSQAAGGGGGGRTRVSPRSSSEFADHERPFTLGSPSADGSSSSQPHYWDSIWPKDLPPVDFNRLPVPAAEVPCPPSPVVPIVAGSSHRASRSTSSLGGGAALGHSRSASSSGTPVLGHSSSSAPTSARDSPSSLHAGYGSSPQGRSPGSPSASPSLIGPTSGAAQRRGSVSMLGPGRSSGGGSSIASGGSATSSPHGALDSSRTSQPTSPKMRHMPTHGSAGSEAPSPGSGGSASSSTSSPDEIARRMRNSGANSHFSPPARSPRSLPWSGSGSISAGPAKPTDRPEISSAVPSLQEEDGSSAVIDDESAIDEPLDRTDSPPLVLPPAVVTPQSQTTPRLGDCSGPAAGAQDVSEFDDAESPPPESVSTESDADDESSPETKTRHPDLHLDLSEEALQPMNPARTDKTPTEELDEAMAMPTDVLPAEIAFEDEGLSTLERIFLLSKSEYAFHRSYIARMLGDMLEDVDPCETVEYVIPLLNNFAMDEDETVKEAFATQLHRVMWYYFTTCSLVSVDEDEDDGNEQDELPVTGGDRSASPRPGPNQDEAPTSVDVFDDLVTRERKASIVSSATSDTPSSMTPSSTLDQATSTVSSGTTISSMEQPATSYGFANPFNLDSPSAKLSVAPLIEPPVIAVHIFTPLIGSMLLSQNPAVADPTRAAVVAVLAKMRGAKGLTVDGWELPDRTPGTKTFLSQTGAHAHLSDEIAAGNRRMVIRELVHGVILGMGRLESELPEHLLHDRHSMPRTASDESDSTERRPGLQRTLSRASTTSYASDSRDSAIGAEAGLFRQQMQQEATLGRAISMNLIASVAEYFSADELARYGFLQTVLATYDDEPGVKTEAAMALAYLAKVAPDSDVDKMLSLFENFVADDSEPVRQSACLCLPAICKRIRSPSDRRSYAVRAVHALISSGDLVQFTVLEILGEVIHMFEEDGGGPPEELLDIYLSQSTRKSNDEVDRGQEEPAVENNPPLLREFDDIDRAGVSAFNFPAVCLSIGKDRWQDLRTTYIALCEIDHPRIVRSMSASIHDLAKILGPSIASADLLPRFRLYLTLDDETRERALAHLPVFLANLPPFDAWEILEDIVQAWDSSLARNWHHREMIAEHLPALFAELPMKEERSPVLLRLLQVAVLDGFNAIREAAIRGLPSIFVIVRAESRLDDEFTRVLRDLRSDSAFKRRKTFIDCVRALVSRSLHTIDPDIFKSRIFQLLKGLQDDVVDVRIALAKLFGTLCAKDGLYPLVVSRPPELVDMLHKLKEDASEYVRAPLATVELEEPKQHSESSPLRLRGGGSAGGKVFVTVGSTYFDSMIEAVLSTSCLDAIRSAGYNTVHVQYGKGILPSYKAIDGLRVEVLRYVSEFDEAMAESSLVISHAGSGSILAALRAGKSLIVVPNTQLMDNHQLELASKLSDGGYLAVAAPSELTNIILEVASGSRAFQPFPAFQPDRFRAIVEDVMKEKTA